LAIHIGRDAGIHQVIGNVMLEPKDTGTTLLWKCTANGTGTRQIQVSIAPHANITPGELIEVAGKTWRVYKYNAGTPQEFGFIFAVKMIIDLNPMSADWVPMTATTSQGQILPAHALTLSHGQTYIVGVYKGYGIVKTIAGYPVAGIDTGFVPSVVFSMHSSPTAITSQPPPPSPYPSTTDYNRVQIAATNAACTTPLSSSYKLPMVNEGDLQNLGDTAGEIPFELNISACPHLHSIQYKWMAAQPGGGEAIPDNSTLPLLTGSTAQGVGVQILDANGNLAVFGVEHGVSTYPGWFEIDYNHGGIADSMPPANHTLSMKARYIRLAGPIQAGTVKAGLIFHMIYK